LGGTLSFNVDSAKHPLSFIHVTPGALLPAECAAFVAAAEARALASGGWQRARHRRHATTDVDCRADPCLHLLVDAFLERTLIPLLSACFKLPRHCMVGHANTLAKLVVVLLRHAAMPSSCYLTARGFPTTLLPE
jgi:hypothetical protein